jgi:hypothetical protein
VSCTCGRTQFYAEQDVYVHDLLLPAHACLMFPVARSSSSFLPSGVE